MKSWPKTMTVCGIPYSVVYVSSAAEVDSDNQALDLWGQADHSLSQIRLRTHSRKGAAISPEQMLATLLHEALHAMFVQHKLLKVDLSGNADTEDFIDTFAHLWADLLVRNGIVELPAKPKKKSK